MTLAALAALGLGGCSDLFTETTPAAAPTHINDPVIAFAAQAAPGATESVVLPQTGQTAQLRLVRAYAAASGRECREVQVYSAGADYTRLLCQAGGVWSEARPLLRSGAARP